MRKKGIWGLVLITVLCCFAFAAYRLYSKLTDDHSAPEISFQSDVLEVSVGASEAELLQGVTAWDARDGDVTASIVIEGISNLSSNQLATATYAAFDQAGNVSKAQRTLHFVDYQSPRFSLSAPLVFRGGTSFDVLNYVRAEDVIDGPLDDKIKATLVSGETVITEEGVHEVEFRVTNSMKDTVYLTVPVEVYAAGTYNANVVLSDYLVYLKQGDSFDRSAYLEEFRFGSEVISLSGNNSGVSVSYDSDVNTGIPGTYSVAYTVKSGEYTGYTRLIVIVEE